jgi:hypothetical protein
VFQVFLVVTLVLVSATLAGLLLIVPWQAQRRGLGFASWFVLQILAFNPVYPLILIATLPNRSRMRLRDQLARDLDERLRQAARSTRAPAAAGIMPPPAPEGTLGELPTTDALSIGDQVTRDPAS